MSHDARPGCERGRQALSSELASTSVEVTTADGTPCVPGGQPLTTGGRRRTDPPLSAAASRVPRPDRLPSSVFSDRKDALRKAQLESVARLREKGQQGKLR